LPVLIRGHPKTLITGNVMIDEYKRMPMRKEPNGFKLNLFGKATLSNIVCAFL